jgi:hypothetical protein
MAHVASGFASFLAVVVAVQRKRQKALVRVLVVAAMLGRDFEGWEHGRRRCCATAQLAD